MLSRDLPIYKSMHTLARILLEETGHFNKNYKYSLGLRLCTETVNCFVLIQLANRAEDMKERYTYLQQFSIKFDVITGLLELANDLRCLSVKKYAQIIELTTEIGKQITGWKKSTI